MKRKKTFEVEYNYFAPGTKVTPISNKVALEMGKVYVVEKCFEPEEAGDDCIVTLVGRPFGVSTVGLSDDLSGIDQEN